MAKGKKAFVLYVDQREIFEELPDDYAGKLIKHIFSYVSDESPKADDLILKIAFSSIKAQLKRDLKKYEEKSAIRSELGRLGGIKSGEARRTKPKQSEANEAIASKTKQNEQDIVIVIDKDNKERGFENFWIEYHNTTGLKKTDREAALKYWKKLTDKEKEMAVQNIKSFYESNPKYVKKARTYLGDKNFNDEFGTKILKPSNTGGVAL